MTEIGELFSVDFTMDGFEITSMFRRTKDGFELIHHEMPDEAISLSLSHMDNLALDAAQRAQL